MKVSAKKAVVLAAGLGTRLRPLTCAVPKPLMPVWGEPMLARIVASLRALGVNDIVVNCHYLHVQVEAWVEEQRAAAGGALKIRASYEPEILGTGGVLNPLRDWIGNEPFYLVNGDIVVDGFAGFGAAEEPRLPGAEVIGWCLTSDREGPRTIEAEPDHGFVTCWKSPDPGWEGTFTYCGIALLKPEILRYVAPEGFSTIVEAYGKAMMDGRFMVSYAPKDLLWTDAGTVESYIAVNRDGDEDAFAAIPPVKAALAACPQLASGGAAPKVEFLGARGSDRCFFRAPGAVIVVSDDSKRGENAKYAGHARWLKAHGVPVPDVLAELPEMKTVVMEDAGSTDLQKRVAKAGPKAIESYVPVVEALARFNALDPSGLDLEPPFDDALWEWERELFREHCLGRRFCREMSGDVACELAAVAARLQGEPVALVHRDFQSTNVIWKGDSFRFIDFQGMRRGPAAYDLASLLYDPYVTFTDGERRALAGLYGKTCGRMEIVDVLPFAAVQRLVQALGAYGRLASVGQPQFGRWVLPALRNLLSAADDAGLAAVGALAEDLLAAEVKASAGHDCHCHGHHEPGHVCHCHEHGHDE